VRLGDEHPQVVVRSVLWIDVIIVLHPIRIAGLFIPDFFWRGLQPWMFRSSSDTKTGQR